MDLNVEQLNCLSRIVAEEIKKLCEKLPGSVELTDSNGHSHLTREGGRVYEVTFARNLFGGVDVLRWYLIHPSKSDNHVTCYPHISQAETIISKLRTAEEHDRFRDQIDSFRRDNRQVQKFLASISNSVGEGPGGSPKDKYWIIDPQKLFQYFLTPLKI